MPVVKVKSKWDAGDLVFSNIDGTEIARFDADNQALDIKKAYLNGEELTANAKELNKLITALTTLTEVDGSSENKACLTNGVSYITGATGIADLTLSSPSVGDISIIRIDSLSSGNVVVTTEEGTTFDGTNNTATFDSVAQALVLSYASENTWQIVLNIGGVALSSVS